MTEDRRVVCVETGEIFDSPEALGKAIGISARKVARSLIKPYCKLGNRLVKPIKFNTYKYVYKKEREAKAHEVNFDKYEKVKNSLRRTKEYLEILKKSIKQELSDTNRYEYESLYEQRIMSYNRKKTQKNEELDVVRLLSSLRYHITKEINELAKTRSTFVALIDKPMSCQKIIIRKKIKIE